MPIYFVYNREEMLVSELHENKEVAKDLLKRMRALRGDNFSIKTFYTEEEVKTIYSIGFEQGVHIPACMRDKGDFQGQGLADFEEAKAAGFLTGFDT